MDKTVEHMQLSDMPGFCESIQKWLGERYGKAEAAQIWKKYANNTTNT